MAHSKRISALFFTLALVFGGAVAQSNAADGANFIFRYKTGLTEDVAGDNTHDGVCEEGEDPASPDCVDEEVPGDDEEEPGEVVETVDPVPDWDNGWFGEVEGLTPLRISATTQKTDVGTSKIIYQCFKAEDGYGNYNWWIYGSSTDLPGFDLWAEKIDIVSRSDLGKPLINAVFNDQWMGDVPMAPDPVGGRLAFTNEACVRIQVKEDAIPADDISVNVMVDDYPDEDVVGGTMPGESFWTADSGADFNVLMKPNCTSNCYPGDDGTPKVDTISIEMSTSNYGSEMSWNFSDRVARNDDVFYRCVKAQGPNPYFFWKMTYDPTQQAPEYGGWVKGWDVVPRSQLSTPVAMTHQFEELGDSYSWYEYNHPVTTSDEACIRVKVDASALPAEGVTMDLRVDNTDNADGSMNDPDAYTPWRWEYIYINTTCKYGCRPPAEDRVQDGGFTFDRDPEQDVKVSEGLDPLIVTPTTRQNHGDIIYQCFAISGGFGNYLTKSSEWSSGANWQDGYDIVSPANVSQPMNEDELYAPQWMPSYFTYGDTTTNSDFCVRVRPRQDGTGDRDVPLWLKMKVVDTRMPNDGWSPATSDFQSFNFDLFVTPEQEQSDNDDDGVCKFGETGSDCDGLCYPGEEGSGDCDWPEEPGFASSYIDRFGYEATQPAYLFPQDDPEYDSYLWISRGGSSGYAVTYSGQHFSYQCFNSTGPWDSWTYRVDLDLQGGGYGWLTNLDLVLPTELYSSAVTPLGGGIDAYYPSPESMELTTSKQVCMRWVAGHPQSGEHSEAFFWILGTNHREADVATDYRITEIHSGYIVPN